MRTFLLFVFLSLTGCQTDAPATASGSPEVTISGVTPEQVKPQIVSGALNRGLKLKSDSAYQLTFERPWGGQVGAALVGTLVSTDGSAAVERLTFSIADVGGSTRIVAERYMVKIGSFGREVVNPANNGLGLEPLQSVLESVTASVRPATGPKR